MRPLEDVWADHDAMPFQTTKEYMLIDELRRWTEEQRRLNVGILAENQALKKRIHQLEHGPAGQDDHAAIADEFALGLGEIDAGGR